MAALPPRKNPTPTKISRQHLSPLQLLLQMGFTRHRVEKALAATGHRGIQLASDWLLAHVKDPALDTESPREYVIYLCPTGVLADEISTFHQEAMTKCGWNGANNYLPHITVCPFFKSPDENCENLVTTLKEIVQTVLAAKPLPCTLILDKYISPNYIGLFINEQQADVIHRISAQFIKEVASPTTSSRESPSKDLHLTLAYSFLPAHYPILETLAAEVNPASPARWEIRLYSRDTRVIDSEVYHVLYSHVPRESDELELLIGDFVYVSSEAITNSVDGWAEGTSWLTGCSGFFPINYLERTAESDAWTLHKSIPIFGGSDDMNNLLEPRVEQPPISLSLLNLLENSERSRRTGEPASDSEKASSRHGGAELSSQGPLTAQEIDALYAKVHKRKKSEPIFKFPIEGPRKVYIARHGERVDFTFGDWLHFCFESGVYHRKDLNMPEELPVRDGTPGSFFKDCPLTHVGLLQARLTGEAMRKASVQIHHVYCSPSLRCVQTCTNILKGLGIAEEVPLNMEPGLFEWLAWYHDGMAEWMSNKELVAAGFNINMDYTPVIGKEELGDTHESCEEFYRRNAYVTQVVINNTENLGGNILLVGHAATLDTCSRHLLGRPPRNAHDMTSLIMKVPYCSVACVAQDQQKKWCLEMPSFPPFAHSANMRFDYRVLNS